MARTAATSHRAGRMWRALVAVLAVACTDPEPSPRSSGPSSSTPAISDSGSSTVPSVSGPGAMEQSGVVACEAPRPADAPPFTRQVLDAGCGLPPVSCDPADPDAERAEGARGVIVADLDGDDVLDLVVPRLHEPLQVWFGERDDGFRFELASTPLDPPVLDSTGGSAVDADGDGDLDVLLVRQASAPLLLVNDGAGAFTTVEVASGPGGDGCASSASWGDLDLDGDLDLFIGRLVVLAPDGAGGTLVTPCPSILLENRGDLVFDDRSDMLPAEVQATKIQSSGFIDLDGDRYPELYAIADPPVPALTGSMLLANDGGTLVPARDWGLDVRMAGMGLAINDLNDDDVWDLVVAGSGEIKRFESEPELGIWVDVAQSVGLVPSTADGQLTAWGGELVDLDNDTRLDLVMSYGSRCLEEPDEIYRQTEDGVYERVGAAWAFDDRTDSRGTVTADLDRNGWLDIVKREFGGLVTVDVSQCASGTWMLVRLYGPAPNTRAIGATVRVVVDDLVMKRPIEAGSTSYRSGAPPEAHFGLGAHETVDAIEVVWPDGAVSVFEDIAANQVLDVHYAP